MSLTEAAFWDSYWEKCQLPATVNPELSFDRCLARVLRSSLAGCHGDVLEIGCAPGKWLALLAREFDLRPSGIDYSSIGIEMTIRNFEYLGINPGFLMQGNFFNMQPQRRFDIVMSLGFIEHFDDAEDVVSRHLEWLFPNGLLVIGVPNFRGIYRYLQLALNKDILDKHNCRIMNLEFFRQCALHLNLKIRFLDYIGSFEPALPVALPGIHNIRQILVKGFLKSMAKIRRIKAVDHFNHPFISSYILAIYQK